MGNTKLARDWSKHSIPLVDFNDFVLKEDLEAVDLLGSQAHAAGRLFYFSFLLHVYICLNNYASLTFVSGQRSPR